MKVYPAEALNTDVISVWTTGSAVDDPVLQLIVSHGASNTAKELTAILH